MNDFDEIEDRVNLQEMKSSSDKSKLNLSMRSHEVEFESYKENLEGLREEIKKLNLDIGHIKLQMLFLIKSLRASSSKSELERLNKKTDSWNPQSYITKRQFIKMLRDYK